MDYRGGGMNAAALSADVLVLQNEARTVGKSSASHPF